MDELERKVIAQRRIKLENDLKHQEQQSTTQSQQQSLNLSFNQYQPHQSLNLSQQQSQPQQQSTQSQQQSQPSISSNARIIGDLFKQLTKIPGVNINDYAVMKIDAPLDGELFDHIVSKTTMTPLLVGSDEVKIERCNKKIQSIDKRSKRDAIVRRVCYLYKTLHESSDAVQRREYEKERLRLERIQKQKDRRDAEIEKKRIRNEDKIKLEVIKNENQFAEQANAKIKYDELVRKNIEIQKQLMESQEELRKLQPVVFRGGVPPEHQMSD